MTEFSDRLNEARGGESIRPVAARAAMGGHFGPPLLEPRFAPTNPSTVLKQSNR